MPVLKQNEVFAGRYLLDQLIGEGGFSEVWMARDQMADDAVVAIKIYAANGGLDEWGLRQFKNEFSLTHNLSHPHLLKVNHFDVADGAPYLIMTYCPHGSLGEGLRRSGVYSERQVALVMSQIGSALEEIHRQYPAIIHQDIKPDNILLLQPETFVLADFGVSSRIRNTLSKTTANLQALTVAYAPPERFDHRPTADAASDIFSLGVTLYEMCTNEVPWEGAGGQCLLKGARVPTLPAGFSPALSKILEACMSADRSKRPTATEITQKGRHYLETGQWPMAKQKRKLLDMNKTVVSSLATAAVAFVAIAGVTLYDLEPGKSSEKPIDVSSAPIVEGSTDIEEKSPAIMEKSTSLQAEKPAEKATQPLKQATELSQKKVPVQQKSTKSQVRSRKAPATEKLVVQTPIINKEALEVQEIELQPAPADVAPAVKKPRNQPKETEATAASGNSKISSSKVNRPATSNTTISKAKKTWFKASPKSKTVKKKNAHKKRVRKLKRRFS
ncbi:serine/threonine-protein kinase [Cesiribacter sp. SM1]|uniref:serine/threonine protein kinase n=1 Tax=Cesiribacter sp. SM1 TaxID=2861196 RepID=UPI001CD577EA|nr:serine/threonine-protein kinase [Cesiribacter sp. SM1]